jgi:hypothetical protein
MRFPVKLERLTKAYTSYYDKNNWFIPNANVIRVLSYQESPHQSILFFNLPIRTRKFLGSSEMNCSIVRFVITLTDKHLLIIENNVECQSFSVQKASVELFAVLLNKHIVNYQYNRRRRRSINRMVLAVKNEEELVEFRRRDM